MMIATVLPLLEEHLGPNSGPEKGPNWVPKQLLEETVDADGANIASLVRVCFAFALSLLSLLCVCSVLLCLCSAFALCLLSLLCVCCVFALPVLCLCSNSLE